MWLGNVDNTAFWSNWSYPSQHHVSRAKRLKLVCLVLVWLGSVENTTLNAFETSVSGISVAWNCWKHHWFQRFLVGWLMSWEEVTLFHFKSCAFIRSKPHYCQRGDSLFIPRAALSLGRGHTTCQTQWFRMFLDFFTPTRKLPRGRYLKKSFRAPKRRWFQYLKMLLLQGPTPNPDPGLFWGCPEASMAFHQSFFERHRFFLPKHCFQQFRACLWQDAPVSTRFWGARRRYFWAFLSLYQPPGYTVVDKSRWKRKIRP